MSHLRRSRAKANEARRKLCALKQAPLPTQEQAARREANQAAHASRYPHPPSYSDAWGRKPRTQPACYDLGVNEALVLLQSRLALMRMRRAGLSIRRTG